MPESEPKPRLIELVAPGAGQGWKAVLRNGKAAVVHEIPVPPPEAAAAVPRMQRLHEHRHPALSPVLAWGIDNNGLWVAVEPNEGTPLGAILTRGPLTPPAAAALGAAVLSGVAALHEAGIAMGGFGAQAIRVTTNGDVRLAGHPAAAVRGAPSQSDLRADVRSCGMAVCAAFGVDPAGAPAPGNIPPGLVVTMRSMASGAMGPSADRAQGALREMAAALLAPDRQMQAQSELATRAGGREVPAITPFLPEGTVAPARQTPSAPVPAAAPPAPAPSPPAPAPAPTPYIAPPRREEDAVRHSVYEAPDRPLQTYPAMPAITFAPAAATPAPTVEPPAAEPARPEPAIPTWGSDAPYAAPAAASATTLPAAPAEPEAPAPAPEPEPEPEKPSGPLPWEYIPPAAATTSTNPPAPAFSTSPPVPAAPPAQPEPAPAPSAAPSWSTVTPAATPPAEAAPPPPVERPPAAPTWTPMEQPAWTPGKGVPAEPLGTGEAIPALELAALQAAAPVESRPSVAVATPPPATRTNPPSAPARKPVQRPRSGDGAPSERPAWLVPAAIAAAVVILLGIFGVIVLANRGGGTGTAVNPSPSTRPTTSPKTSPSPSSGGGLQTVPTYGPNSASPVKSIQICTATAPCKLPGQADEKATACTLSSCRIEVAVYFTAAQKAMAVSYTLKFFDRCTGQTTDLPGTQTTTKDGWTVVIPTDHLSVRIPAGVKSGALVAVSSKPTVAASQPLLLGASSC
jgi:hypothetical protein